MLHVAPGVKVYLACQPVDMRRGFDGLSADVAQILAADPFSGCQSASKIDPRSASKIDPPREGLGR
jgi:transposase